MKNKTQIVLVILSYIGIASAAMMPYFMAMAQNPDPALLLMQKLQVQAVSIGGGCFFPIQIRMNVTYIGQSTYTIGLSNFWLIVTNRNIVVTNSTNISYQNPNNLIFEVRLFPNIPVSIILGFPPTCVTNINLVRLLYADGTYTYTFTLP